ncbi:type IV pilin [Halogeometricum limi]|uniref:Flagellin N-terminal-like domain-containing protein n=1 Tax=Halogeometricum limi TaxID=555875 RepID=A0A1I6ITN1_9EURY|nr:type IV pilin N-terminal domain-containing protein [Halogeometricum limi]SFR70095.1 flagellin N-terminal-like domain-containing protein [Halogeometricum limi]
MYRGNRAVSSVIGVILMIAVVVVVSSSIAFYFWDVAGEQTPAPQISVSHELVQDGDEQTIAVTLEAGNAVQTDRLYVIGSKNLDIGGAPGSATPALERYSSEREAFTESSGGRPPQVGIGETWEAGETVYLDPDGSVDGVTVELHWNTRPVQNVNPGTVEGSQSYKIAEFTIS